MKEEQFKGNVIELARTLGWRIHHDRPGRLIDGAWRTAIEGDAGFPDLVLVRRGRLIFAELKGEHGRPSAEQNEWLTDLFDVVTPPVVCIWRPSDIQQVADMLGPKRRT